jgi:glycosyltransferase involved in cell wall biosynthesis
LQKTRPENVVLLPWQPEEALPFTLTTADVGIVSLERDLTGLAIPSKAFYFLAAGVPIIALCEQQTELTDIVQEFGCGSVIPPGQPTELAAMIERLTRDPQKLDSWRAGAAAARTRFARVRNTEIFLRTLETCLRLKTEDRRLNPVVAEKSRTDCQSVREIPMRARKS